MNEQEYFGDIGGAYEEEQAERLKECATLIAEKAGVSLEEAAFRKSKKPPRCWRLNPAPSGGRKPGAAPGS